MELNKTDELSASKQEEEYREVFTRDGVSQGRIVPKHSPASEGDYFKQILVILKTKDSPEAGKGVGHHRRGRTGGGSGVSGKPGIQPVEEMVQPEGLGGKA